MRFKKSTMKSMNYKIKSINKAIIPVTQKIPKFLKTKSNNLK